MAHGLGCANWAGKPRRWAEHWALRYRNSEVSLVGELN